MTTIFYYRRQHAPGPIFLKNRRSGFYSTSRKREGIEARLLDLRDYPMPFFDQALPPAMPGRPPYEHEAVKTLDCPNRRIGWVLFS